MRTALLSLPKTEATVSSMASSSRTSVKYSDSPVNTTSLPVYLVVLTLAFVSEGKSGSCISTIWYSSSPSGHATSQIHQMTYLLPRKDPILTIYALHPSGSTRLLQSHSDSLRTQLSHRRNLRYLYNASSCRGSDPLLHLRHFAILKIPCSHCALSEYVVPLPIAFLQRLY